MKWVEANWNDEPWWQKVFGKAWYGIVDEACRAGMTESAARAAAEAILDELLAEWSACRAEMTVGMFKVRVLTLARRRIAESVVATTEFWASVSERPPYEVSNGWRQRYPESLGE